MNKGILLFIVFIFWGSYNYASGVVRKDSVGIEKKGKMIYVLHKVDPKETLFSLAKRYNTDIDDIFRHNPSVREGLKIDEMLKIPYSEKSSSGSQEGLVHRVESSETLFSISKKYDVSTAEIRKANNLPDNNINIGQRLVIPSDPKANGRISSAGTTTADNNTTHIVEGGETLFGIARQHNVNIGDLKDWNSLKDNNLEIGQELVVGKPGYASPVANDSKDLYPDQKTSNMDLSASEKEKKKENENKKEDPILTADRGDAVKRIIVEDNAYQQKKLNFKDQQQKKYQKVTESGLAEVIEGSDDTRKYLAVHKNAPVGTIMQVKNEMNNLSVFVRVIGNLPDTGDNAKIRVRLSKTAYDRLGAIDPRFPVEISYVK